MSKKTPGDAIPQPVSLDDLEHENLALHLVEMKQHMYRLEQAAQQTASKSDLFRFGVAIMMVVLVGGFSILFQIDGIGSSSGFHFAIQASEQQSNAVVPASLSN